MTPEPLLTDGQITLRPVRETDRDAIEAGHDEAIAHWLGDVAWDADGRRTFVVEVRDPATAVGLCSVRATAPGTGELTWLLFPDHRGVGHATRAVRVLGDWALSDLDQGGLGLGRVEARIEPGNSRSLRVATRAGLRREGVARLAPGTGERADTAEKVVFARLSTDPPLSDPVAFRSLLNSFLPRKRAISQMLVRDEAGRVLLCQLTYKRDWDLPGGVVEVGESPRLAVEREVEEELGLGVAAGELLVTDWLPPWGGWDDAVCLVFDGGTAPSSILDEVVKQDREIRSAEFCTLEQVHERTADFTARRIEAALRGGGRFTESGR
ncbi:MAG: NUDIX hydrolase [Nocardioides sp.]|uniref:NUDIX hydrolase n=1 Tax=Nocardioides sp. TaxID=35761 RepID=UPI003EFF3569